MIANSNFLGANTSHNTNLMFVEKEILAEYGHFIVKMLSLQKSKTYAKDILPVILINQKKEESRKQSSLQG